MDFDDFLELVTIMSDRVSLVIVGVRVCGIQVNPGQTNQFCPFSANRVCLTNYI